ncbi:MAG: RNA polymerase sigma-70 factor [Bacteroidota bacterium]
MSVDQKEQQWLSRISKGDRSALEELFREYYTPLVRFAYTKLQDSELAEDVVQEVFVKLWNIRENVKINTSLKSYLYTATKNLSLNEIAKVKRHAELNEVYVQKQEQAAEPMSEDERSVWDERIQEAISGLPPRCQEVFRLSRFEGMTYQEIADHLKISPKTVENQMGKGLSLLRKSLAAFVELCWLGWLLSFALFPFS